ncbi:MAG: AbrB/MazE/SpoVT family DNA-binding domain-containing protein [Nevskia sp.]|nr:AbrB/MazE/SpoVT family DNA-binding domain-containing protein [Nevskia sp.]
MTTTSVTSKGQVTIPKRVRQLLGIGPGSKLAFDVEGATARIRLVQAGARSRVEDGPAILNYSGPRIAVSEMNGGAAMKRASVRARR